MSRVMHALATINITFLGTASAQPSSTRSHSAMALRLGTDAAVWLFDCGESTQRQIQQSHVKMGRVKKIFITHTHGDHIFGILPFMAGRLNGAGGVIPGVTDPRTYKIDRFNAEPALEIYGPLGTRAYVRSGLAYTHTRLEEPYVVHELRLPSDTKRGDPTELPLHMAESPYGKNIQLLDGIWQDIFADASFSVSAAPILHSAACVGYVIQEKPLPGKIDPKVYMPDLERTGTPKSVLRQLQQGENVLLNDGVTILSGPSKRPGRKLVICGDTYDPSRLDTIAQDADLLIHEATNAHLPGIDPNTKDTDTHESVEYRTRSRGHSTPQMAGRFAKRIGARCLVLNHFSARYPGNDDVDPEARRIMTGISDLAAQEYGKPVICARDFMSFDIEPRTTA